MSSHGLTLLNSLEDAQWLGDYGPLLSRAHRALKAVLEVHEPIDALMNPGRYERVVKVCVGCGTDDGNFQRWPCPTIRAIEGA